MKLLPIFLLSCFAAFAVEPLEVYNPANCVPYSLNNTPAWPATYCRTVPQWYLNNSGEESLLYQNGLIYPSGTEPGGNNDLNLIPGRRADGVIVGIIDTGCNPHEDLAGVLIGGAYINDRPPAAFIEGQYGDWDPYGHGTGIASIIAAERNGIGMAGVAPGAKLLIVSTALVFPEYAAGNVAKGIVWLVNHGARVICLSWGESDTPNSELYTAMIHARNNGVAIASAVRYGGNLDQTPTYPYAWNFDHYVAVCGTTRTGTLISGTAIGSRVVGAPGDRIVMASVDDPYVYDNGNSFASPMVAGILAQMRARQPSYPSAAVFVNRIKTSAAMHPVAGIMGNVDATAALARM